MTCVVFWGGTGQARVLREALDSGLQVVAVFDQRQIASPFADVPLFVGEEGFKRWRCDQPDLSRIRFCVAIGGSGGRDRVARHQWLAAAGLQPLTVRHRTAFIAGDAEVAEGCQILAQAAVCTHVRLGRCVIINTAASIDHDCTVADGAHVGPGAVVAGEARIGPGAFIGAGATILPHIRIGDDAIVGAGAVVTRDVPPGVTVMGIPATPYIRRAERGHASKTQAGEDS